MNISDYLRTALLNHVMDVAPYTPPNAIYAGLFTVAPTNNTGGTEVSATDYNRVATSWNAAVTGSINNSVTVRFPASGEAINNWGVVIAVGLFDSSTAGHLLFFGPLSAPVSMPSNSDFAIATTDLTVTFS